MKINLRSRFVKGMSVGVAALAVAASLSACGSSSSSKPSNTNLVRIAEPPATPPNYIFPFMGLQFFSVSNINQFQFLMYRPLYWFGKAQSPNVNYGLSLASAPVYSNGDKTVTVNLKNYKWSNGTAVTAENVIFWMNMMHAEKANWADYTPGALPDDLTSVTAPNASTVVFNLKASVNPYWFTYNELSQITPMPNAWDITATGGAANSGGCAAVPYGTADAQCSAVYTYLSKQSGYDPANPQAANNSLSTYATNPIWQVVDGPFHLTHFDASGNVTFAANPSYGGPVKATIKQVKLVPFTTDTAEFNALVGGKVDVGYLPSQDITGNAVNAGTPGPNNSRLGNYNLVSGYSWSINYFPMNFNSTGDGGNAGPIFKQLYFRQAFQTLVDQALYIKKIDKGYGVPTYGPVPAFPKNQFASSYEQSDPYAYNVAKAVNLLKVHGWTVVPSGTTTCTSPGTGAGHCGAGIAKGAKLAFNLQYASGSTALTQLMTDEKSSWAQAGINVTLGQASFNTVLGNAVPCASTSASCTWEMANWGAGWIFAPDYYPSGEAIFATGAGSNSGSYSDATNDANILATTNKNVPLNTYENYLTQQLPVVFQPNPTATGEINKSLKGYSSSTLQQLNPEEWSW